MRRKVETRAPQAIPQHSVLQDETRTFRFITPVFGGGVRVKKDDPNKLHDEVTPVRVPSIRGQLRFWWRAVNPRGCRDVEALRKAEAEVFGCAAGGKASAGTLDVAVEKAPSPPDKRAVLLDGDKFKHLDGMQAIAYGAFPLRDTNGQQHGRLHVFKGDWTVRFRYDPAIAEDVQAALWAWAHFGGLGGRTRRGFGAIEQTSPGLPDLAEGWKRWVRPPDDLPVGWPHLTSARSSVIAEARSCNSGDAAQDTLLRLLRDLRQGSLGRKSQSSRDSRRPGRSYWPEADVIRKEARIVGGPHGTPITDVSKLPRAMFGMPIITHFKEERGDPQEPPDSTMLPSVHGTTRTRWASPLVLRPRCIGKNQYVPAALRLRQAEPDTIVLQGIQGARQYSPVLTPQERRTLRPFENHPDATNVIDLYLQLLKTR